MCGWEVSQRVTLTAVGAVLFATVSAALGTGHDLPRSERTLVFNCYACHGTDGRSPGSIPSINGQSISFLKQRLMEFKRDQRDPTIMNRIAKGYSDEEIARIADYIGRLE